MQGITLTGLLIRFLLGGGAVVLSSLMAKRVGGRLGGVFAAFPAVFLAALLTMGIDLSGAELVGKSIVLSQGALVGTGINLVCAAAAGYLISTKGWKQGLVLSVSGWLAVSTIVTFLAA